LPCQIALQGTIAGIKHRAAALTAILLRIWSQGKLALLVVPVSQGQVLQAASMSVYPIANGDSSRGEDTGSLHRAM